jgi:hypothetical protein
MLPIIASTQPAFGPESTSTALTSNVTVKDDQRDDHDHREEHRRQQPSGEPYPRDDHDGSRRGEEDDRAWQSRHTPVRLHRRRGVISTGVSGWYICREV